MMKMIKLDFFWDDLTEEKKKEILDIIGDNHNWDVFPFYVLELEDNEND